ncbi:MAG: helix-turn-helix domain-containing protein [Ruminococcus sp.]|nr:helix-turn-helix domain-containing protein [Ruminococcus sp.]MCD7800585.1 helix-turn-helix domain-containing protein [Ruminococcus sp.]
MNTIGDRIINMRDTLNINQKTLAGKINVTSATMCKYENNINVPNADILKLLADTLNTTTDYLTCRTNIKHNPYRVLDEVEKKIDIDLINLVLELSYEDKIKIIERATFLKELEDKV